MNINAETQINLVVGDPVRHSQSPAFHQSLYQKMGINAVMIAVDKPGLHELITSIKTLCVRLTAVTLPYKTVILEYVDELSPEVNYLRAANTLILKNGKITAHNTDVFGIEAALAQLELKGKKVLIVGAGGSARALGYVLSHKKAELVWLNRSLDKAQDLANVFGGVVVGQDQVDAIEVDLIVNCTPIGMRSNGTPLPDYKFNPNQTVFDLVYTPEMTPFLLSAQKDGASIITGMEMFKAQAQKQIALAYEVIS